MKIRTVITITSKEQKAALETLKEVETLLRDGKGWIQNMEKTEKEEGMPAYCLIGAIREADGQGELVAGVALAAVIEPGDVRWLDFIQENQGLESIEEIVTEYNDQGSRKFADIRKTLKKAIILIEKGEFEIEP